jgi:hypothetical protein
VMCMRDALFPVSLFHPWSVQHWWDNERSGQRLWLQFCWNIIAVEERKRKDLIPFSSLFTVVCSFREKFFSVSWVSLFPSQDQKFHWKWPHTPLISLLLSLQSPFISILFKFLSLTSLALLLWFQCLSCNYYQSHLPLVIIIPFGFDHWFPFADSHFAVFLTKAHNRSNWNDWKIHRKPYETIVTQPRSSFLSIFSLVHST